MKIKLTAALLAVSVLVSAHVNAEVEVTTKGGLKVSSGDFNIEIGGRIQYDYN